MATLIIAVPTFAIYQIVTAASERERDIRLSAERHLATSALSVIEDNLARFAKDYAWWDATVSFTETPEDTDWAENNISTYLFETYDQTFTAVLSPDQKLVYQASVSSDIFDRFNFFTGVEFSSFFQQVKSGSAEESTPMTGYFSAGNNIFLFAASPITPESGSDAPENRHILIFGRIIDHDLLQSLEKNFLLPDLHIRMETDTIHAAAMPIQDIDGKQFATLHWTTSANSAKGLENITLILPSLLTFLTILALVIVFGWIRSSEAAILARNNFLAKMSHELRTPLNPILGFSSIIKDEMFGPLPERYRAYAADIHESGKHLSSIIEDVLDVSRIEAGKLQLNETEIDLNDLIRSVPFISQSLSSRDKREMNDGEFAFVLDLDESIPPIQGDEVRLRQVLMNLLSNARKFSSNKPVHISTAPIDNFVRLTVRDQGVGMSKADLKQLFTPFTQFGNALTKQKEQGAGLGLVVCKELVELHGGKLNVKSEPDVGTEVTVFLPT